MNLKIAFSIALGFLGTVFGLCLLYVNKLSGSEFISLTIFFMVFALILSNFEKVIEFSVGGAALKLKQTTQEAKDTIKELKDLRVETFKLLIKANIRNVPSWSYIELVEHRSEEFINIYEKIKANNCFAELSDDIEKSINILLKQQLNGFEKYLSKDSSITLKEYGDTPKPIQISFLIGKDSFEKNIDSQIPSMETLDKVKCKFELAVENYSNLYQIKQEIQKLREL